MCFSYVYMSFNVINIKICVQGQEVLVLSSGNQRKIHYQISKSIQVEFQFMKKFKLGFKIVEKPAFSETLAEGHLHCLCISRSSQQTLEGS